MSRTNMRFVIAYCFLVILPVVAFIHVLKKERDMSAPRSVDGTWKLKANDLELAMLLCRKSASNVQASSITISQSGKSLMLELHSELAASGPGVIEGDNVKASLLPLPVGPDQKACFSGRLLTLNATVDARAGLGSLAGTLSVEACPTCQTLGFNAARQAHKLSKEEP